MLTPTQKSTYAGTHYDVLNVRRPKSWALTIGGRHKMAEREPDDQPEEANAAELNREGDSQKEGNFVSIKVLGQAIESVGKGGLPDQIDLDALLKAVQRYKQEEGPKESSAGLNGVIPLPAFCPSVSTLGPEVLVKHKQTGEPSQKMEQLQMGSVVDGLPLSATIGPGAIPMNPAILPPLVPSAPLGPHPVLFGAQIRAWPGPDPIHNIQQQLQVPMSQFSAAGLNSGGIVGAMGRESVVLNAPLPTVGVVPGQVPSEAQIQMPAPSIPIRNRMVSRRGPLSKSSPYRGVSCYKRTGRWESHIWHAGRQLHLGTHSTPEEAARVYDIAAIKLRGWGADLNFGAHTYRDDPQLKDLSLHCDKKTEEADVAKLVKGLKRRKGSGAKTTKTKTPKIDVMHENPGAQPGGDFLPSYATEQGLHLSNLPRGPVAPMFFRHPSGQSLLMAHNPVVNSPTAARRFSAEGLGGYLDGNGVVAPGVRFMESSPSMVVGSMPGGSTDQQQQQHAASNGPPALFSNEPPMTWGQEHPPSTAGASHVTPSRVISLARSPTFRQASVQPGIIKPAEPNNQLVWTSMIPNSPGVRVVLDNKAVTALGCQGEYILEGKPMPVGQGITPPGISAFWPGPGEAVPPQGQMTNRDQVLASQGAVCPQQGQDQRGVGVRSQEVASSSMAVPPGPVQSLQSVLQGVTAVGHETLGANPTSSGVTGAVSQVNKPTTSSRPASRETTAQLGDSQQRFAKLLQLIQELPAKDIVRQGPVVEEAPQSNPAQREKDDKAQNHDGDLEGGNDADNVPFEGRQKLRASPNTRSAFKNWTSSDSEEAGKSSDDGQGESGGRSTGHSGSDANQGDKSNGTGDGATCCSSGKGDSPPEQHDGKSTEQKGDREEADQKDGVDSGAGSKADHGAEGQGNKRLMEDDLLAAQQLCQLSQMVGPGSSSGNSASLTGGKKRTRSAPSSACAVTIPAWQTKRQRTHLNRQGRKNFTGMVAPPTETDKSGNNAEQVLSNSGKGNKQMVEGPGPECEESGGVSNPMDTDVSVAGFSDDKSKVMVVGDGDHGWKLEVEEGDNNSKTSTGGMECVNDIDEDEIPPLAKESEGPPISCGGGNGVLDVDCHHRAGLWGGGYSENTTSGSGTIDDGQEKDDCLEEEIATLERVPEIGVPFPMQMSIINE
ncbi:hypothetical protein BSKO_10396 [Bryopsis sp. KO-2023]|nr:hypothetical protein BSKO_10396 [Bryopsis sp. KO-2023]